MKPDGRLIIPANLSSRFYFNILLILLINKEQNSNITKSLWF